MQNESIEIDGKEYISSKRAAKLVGYTKDYVGQLARGGHLEARLIGRSWFVTEGSIRAHKLKVHHEIKKVRQEELIEKKDSKCDDNTIQIKTISEENYSNSHGGRPVKFESNIPNSTKGVEGVLGIHNVQVKYVEGGQYARRELMRSKITYESENLVCTPQTASREEVLHEVDVRKIVPRISPVDNSCAVDTILLHSRNKTKGVAENNITTYKDVPAYKRLRGGERGVLEDVASNRVQKLIDQHQFEVNEEVYARSTGVKSLVIILYIFLILCFLIPVVYVAWSLVTG
jgi:hypothetical protein